MLLEFRVDNFKSLINIDLRPQKMNLLLGENNAGKTNLLQALRFLSAVCSHPLANSADSSVGARHILTNFFLKKPTVDFSLRCILPSRGNELYFYKYHLSIYYNISTSPYPSLEVAHEKLEVSGQGLSPIITLLEKTSDGYHLLNQVVNQTENNAFELITTPSDSTMLSKIFDYNTYPLVSAFKDYMSSWRYYYLSPSSLRTSLHTPNNRFLNVDGGNLSSVIYSLKTTNERFYRNLLSYLKRIEPFIEVINFQGPFDNSLFMFFEDSHGNALPAWHASDGTLRFLALIYIMLFQTSPNDLPLYLIEEPENGLYVGLIKEIVEAVGSLPTTPQIIFTSHSPYFIDLFDNRLDAVFVMKKVDTHSTIVQPDASVVRQRLDSFPLGEQHFRKMLG